MIIDELNLEDDGTLSMSIFLFHLYIIWSMPVV